MMFAAYGRKRAQKTEIVTGFSGRVQSLSLAGPQAGR
jgi:hypothetical protein